MTISIYDPRTMAAALRQMPPARAFLFNLFFASGPPKISDRKKVDVDIQTKGRRAAGFVNPNGPGQVVDREGFTTHTFEAPLLAPKRSITVPDVEARLPGEHIYAAKSADERAKELLGQDLEDLESMIMRRIELMCRDGLVDGEIDISGEDTSGTVTFPSRDSSLTIGTLAAAARWSASTSDPLANLRAWQRAINAQTGLTADVAILGSDAIDALLANTAVASLLDNRRMDMGKIEPQLLDSGATYVGRLNGIDIWGYNELDPDGSPLIAAKTVLMGSTSARCDMHYGAVGVADGVGKDARITLVPAERVPESWVEREPPVRWLKISSRPLPVPVQINGFLTATVLA